MQRESRNLTNEECAQIVVLHEEGWSYRHLGERFGVHHISVSRMMERYRETGSHCRRPVQGRHRVTTSVQDRFLRLRTLRQRFVTTRSLQSQLEDVHNIRISCETVRQRLKEGNLVNRIPARGPALTVAHRRKRLEFVRNHIHWLEAGWNRVLFTDESRFCLYNCDRRIRVYRRQNERYA
ncbi:uncharacterized protein [Diabrotica undecimpunctata]|uniref:uncharacterized protein n=1 Tax=Diabrotica undecimpunctata TaxID=50387 RepID=UPI003B63F7D1